MKRLLIALILTCIPAHYVFSYTLTGWFEESKISVFGGVATHHIEKRNSTEDVNLMNYLSYRNEFYLGVDAHVYLHEQWQFNIKTYLNSSLRTDDVFAKLIYMPHEKIGVTLGYASIPVQYGLYEIHEQPQYYTTIPNSDDIYDFAKNELFLAGLAFPFEGGKFSGTIYLQGGVSYLPNDFSFSWQKKYDSNERRLVEYDIPESYAFIIQPEVEIRWEIAKPTTDTSIGLQFQGKWTYSKRNIDYTRNIYTWTTDNKQTEIISHPKQSIEGVDWNVGLFYIF